MSFVYPRTISLIRPAAQSGEGQLGYGGQTASTDVPVAAGIMCSIQERREGQAAVPGLPGDGTRPTWYVFIPLQAVGTVTQGGTTTSVPIVAGLIKDRDIVVDDFGRRFQVISDYWDSLGYRLTAERLEA